MLPTQCMWAPGRGSRAIYWFSELRDRNKRAISLGVCDIDLTIIFSKRGAITTPLASLEANSDPFHSPYTTYRPPLSCRIVLASFLA